MKVVFAFAVFSIFIVSAGAGAAAPQGCTSLSHTYFLSFNGQQFQGAMTFSVDDSGLVTISNISIDFPGDFENKTLCAFPDYGKPVCISDFTQSISFSLFNATFTVNAYFNSTGSQYEFDFGFGVLDEGSFSFPSGEIFSTEKPCAHFFFNGESEKTCRL